MQYSQNDFLRLTQILALLTIVNFAVGCGIVGIHETYGHKYNIDNSIKVIPGMTQEEVIALLGEPYIYGIEQNGDVVLTYECNVVDGQSFVFGLFLMGEKRTVAVNGGEATITIASDSKKVKKVAYKIIGNSNYNRLRGGGDEKIN